MLIVLEGIDGCGKTYHATQLAEHLGCKTLAFPDYSSDTGRLIKAYLKREWWVDGDLFEDVLDHAQAVALQTMMLANRLEHYEELHQAAGSHSNHLVLQRYWQSGWVYGQIDGLDPRWLRDIHRTLPAADVTIILSVDPSEALRRQAKRGAPLERYEGHLGILKKADDLYHRLPQVGQKIVSTEDGKNSVQFFIRQLIGEGIPQ
jgi:thymidylate kinase